VRYLSQSARSGHRLRSGAAISELFVIARNSSFQYKGKVVDVRQVGRELGVRYVLQGSIRREGGRLRVSAQLADAVTGAHRWAERYDRQIEDVFVVQDEVARTIVAILAAHVNKAEIERSLNKPPETWQAYDCERLMPAPPFGRHSKRPSSTRRGVSWSSRLRSAPTTRAPMPACLGTIWEPDRIDVLMDGGVQRGSHMFKALSVCAKAVGVRRY
jgi:hypothetical protein